MHDSPRRQPAAAALEAAGRKRAQLATIARVDPLDRGVVTATLMACYNLTDGVDPYVKITLTDTHQSRVEYVKSVTKFVRGRMGNEVWCFDTP